MKKHRLLPILVASMMLLYSTPVLAEEGDGEMTTEAPVEITTEAIPDITTETTTQTTDLNTATSNFNASMNASSMTLSEFQNMVDTNSSSFQKLNNDDVFEMMKNSLNAGESVKLTNAFELSTGLTIPDNMMYDLSDCGMDGKVDATSINLQYASLITQMNENMTTAQTDLSSKAISATELFTNTYGDLANQLKTTEATLPDGYDFSSISAQNKTTMSNTYATALQSSEYNTIKNYVSNSDVFAAASKGATKYNLKSNTDMNSLLKTYSSDLEANYNQQKETDMTDMENLYKQYKSEVEEDGNGRKEEVDTYIKEQEEKIQDQKDTVEFETEQNDYYSIWNLPQIIGDEVGSWEIWSTAPSNLMEKADAAAQSQGYKDYNDYIEQTGGGKPIQ